MSEIYKRLTLYVDTPIPSNPRKKHYHVILTDPVENQNTKMKEVVWVPWESFIDDPSLDNTCKLEKGDHKEILWDTRIDYKRAEIISTKTIEERIKNGTIIKHNEPVSEELYNKILKGLYQSEETKPSVETFCKKYTKFYQK